jgi:hypothetical protein
MFSDSKVLNPYIKPAKELRAKILTGTIDGAINSLQYYDPNIIMCNYPPKK